MTNVRSYIALQFKELWSSLTFSKGTCYSIQTLLEENHIFRVIVPNNYTDLFQPLDLSVNKPFKDKLKRGFSECYTQEVAKQLQDSKQPDKIHIDTHNYVSSKTAELYVGHVRL